MSLFTCENGIAVVAPRNMRFSPVNATSIDLHIYETVLWSRYRKQITVIAQEIDTPFTGVAARFWPKGARTARIVEEVSGTDPALIVVHQHLPTANALAKARSNIPVVLIRHNFQKPPRHFLSRVQKSYQFNRLSAVGFVSECCRADFISVWPQVRIPIHVVLNGIDTKQWKCILEKERLVLFVGRIAPEKGAFEAAQAMVAALSKTIASDWRGLFILANAPEHAEYACAVKDEIDKLGGRIKLLFDLPHSEVRRWMAKASIVLAPTQAREPFGRVAIEAMASGAALIASARGGFVEIVGEDGVLLQTPDASSIGQALHDLIIDDGERMRLSMAGRDRVVPRYNLSTSAATFDALVRSVLP